MILFLHVFLIAMAILVGWLLLALGLGVVLGRSISRADEIDLGDSGDEGGGVSDFYSAPHDIGKSISDNPVRIDGEKMTQAYSPKAVTEAMTWLETGKP